ncbi:MAG TPA: hypothetical protein VM925_10575 [Labilithrix sp.]|nr:hypothetical protein [Labilithrix sp.]
MSAPPNTSTSFASRSSSAEPLLVRLGIRYFRDLSSKRHLAEAIDAVHLLNADERRALRRIERGAIIRAAVAGALSTIVAGAVEVGIAMPLLGHEAHATFADHARFYAIAFAATIITSIIEIAYLYWDGLRAVHRLSHEAGLDLFPHQDDDKALAGAMARAALELPNPTATLFGVDPHREASRLRLFVASIVYKLKISVTNFVLKALVRRALGRAFVRGWLPFVAVPITAAWNAFICWLIMREARIRAMGPSAAREMIEIAFAGDGSLSSAAKAAVLRAVASSIVRTEDLHPNLAALLHEVARVVLRDTVTLNPRSRLEIEDGAGDLDDSGAFLRCLAKLERPEQTIVLRVLAIASIIDGRLTRAEKRLLCEARDACGLSHDLAAVERLRRAFIDGDPIDPRRITGL